MLAALVLLAVCVFACPLGAESATRQAPTYTQSSIVNAASNQPGAFAPNTIVALYGSDLAFVTRELRPEDVRDGTMPTLLPGSGVRVLISRISAQIYFVSPGQVNLLIPSNLRTGPADLQLTLDGRAGPVVPIRLEDAAPALFEQAGGYAVAARGDGSVVWLDTPVVPGDVVVLYATGLGETVPPLRYGEIARGAASVKDAAEVRVIVDGRMSAAEDVSYAGVSPGFAGLYQVNWRVPEWAAGDVEVRVAVREARSQAGVKLPVRPR